MRVRDAMLTIVLGTAVCTACASGDEYARPNLLIEPSQLAKPQIARQFTILDARKKEAYDEEHIPGARWVDHDVW